MEAESSKKFSQVPTPEQGADDVFEKSGGGGDVDLKTNTKLNDNESILEALKRVVEPVAEKANDRLNKVNSKTIDGLGDATEKVEQKTSDGPEYGLDVDLTKLLSKNSEEFGTSNDEEQEEEEEEGIEDDDTEEFYTDEEELIFVTEDDDDDEDDEEYYDDENDEEGDEDEEDYEDEDIDDEDLEDDIGSEDLLDEEFDPDEPEHKVYSSKYPLFNLSNNFQSNIPNLEDTPHAEEQKKVFQCSQTPMEHINTELNSENVKPSSSNEGEDQKSSLWYPWKGISFGKFFKTNPLKNSFEKSAKN